MFNSQKINRDIVPWKILDADGDDTGDRTCTPESIRSHETVEYAPRPEFDNNPSDILVAFRAAGGDKNPRGGVAAMASRVLRNEHVWDIDYDRPGVKDHARKVLERLVNVYAN